MTTEAPSGSDAVDPQPPPPASTTMEEDEAAREAIEELERIDRAETFEPGIAAAPPIARYVAPIPQPPRQYLQPRVAPPQYPVSPAAPPLQQSQQEPQASFSLPVLTKKDLQTLEDLYANFPSIGDGNTYLRIERTSPKMHLGHHVAGWLGDLHEKIPMDEFQYRYGGQRYTVSVMVPARGRGDGTPDAYRRAGTVDVTIPGPPAMGTVPHEEVDMTAGRMPGMQGRGMSPQYPYGSQDPTEVQLKRLDMEAEERKRQAQEQRELHQQLGQAVRTPEGYVDAVRAQAAETVQMVERNATEKVQILRTQNEALLNTHVEDEKKLAELNRQLTEAQRQLAEAQYRTETEAVRQAKDRHEIEMRKAGEMHSAEVARLAEAHRTQMAEASLRNNEERQRLIEAEGREKERIRGDALAREAGLRADIDRRERDSTKTTDQRVADIQRQMDTQLASMRDMHTREMSSLKDAHDREIHATRTAEEMKTSLARETTSLKVDSVQDRLARAEADAARFRGEAEELRSKINKPFPEAMREAREMGLLLGMQDKGEGAPAEEELDWKKVVANGVKDLIGQAPATFKAVMDARAQNQAQAQQQQAQAQQQQQYAQQQYGGGYAGPPQQQAPQQPIMAGRAAPRRRMAMAPPPAWAQAPGPPGPGAAPYAPPPSMVGPAGPQQGAYIQAPVAAVSMAPQPGYGYGPTETPANEEVRIAHSPLDGPAPTPEGAAAAAASLAMRSQPVHEYASAAPFPPPPPGLPAQQPFAAPAAAPVAPGGYVSPFAQQAQPFDAPEPPPAQPQRAAPTRQLAAPQAAPEAPAITSDQVASFVGQLGLAAQNKFPAASFAEEFIKQAGRETAANLLTMVSPKQLIELVGAAPGGKDTQIYSPEGQAYTFQVWSEARRILGM